MRRRLFRLRVTLRSNKASQEISTGYVARLTGWSLWLLQVTSAAELWSAALHLSQIPIKSWQAPRQSGVTAWAALTSCLLKLPETILRPSFCSTAGEETII